jgi:hypothetical protein
MPLPTPPPASRGELHSRPSMLQLLSASPPPPFLEAAGPHRQSLLPSPSPKCHRFSTAEPPRRQAPSTVSPHRCELARRHPLAAPHALRGDRPSSQRAVTAPAGLGYPGHFGRWTGPIVPITMRWF